MDADAYTLGMFAVAVGGILALVWMILRAVTILSLANRPDKYSFEPLKLEKPIPPPTPPPPPPSDEETQINWPQRETE